MSVPITRRLPGEPLHAMFQLAGSAAEIRPPAIPSEGCESPTVRGACEAAGVPRESGGRAARRD